MFDTNRGWTIRLNLLAILFPEAKMVCCVRHIPWILDSIERLLRRNELEPSKMFAFEAGGTAYSRAEGLMSASGMVGFALNALKQAMHGAQSDRLLLLPYDALVRAPATALEAIYAFTGLPAFTHDFDNLVFDATEFDARLARRACTTSARRSNRWTAPRSCRPISGSASKGRASGAIRRSTRGRSSWWREETQNADAFATRRENS